MIEEYTLTAKVSVETTKAERDLENVAKKADKAKESLEGTEKGAKKTGEKLEGMGASGAKSVSQLSSALKSLAGAFGLVLTAGAVVTFIKRVADSNRVLHQMSSRTGNAAKDLMALQNQFKALGFSASQADALIEDAAKSFASFRYNGQLDGIAKAFAMMGVAIMDAKGNMRNVNDMLVEAGEKALTMSGGDETKAQQLLMSRGFDKDAAYLASRRNARERMQQMQAEAAASKEAAASAEKLNKAITNLGNRFYAMVVELDEKHHVFDKLGNALEKIIPAVGVLTAFISRMFSAIEGAFQSPVLRPLLGLLKIGADTIANWEKDGFLGALGKSIDEVHLIGQPKAAPHETASQTNDLSGLIGKGEGGYNSVNLGKKYGNRAGNRNLTGMTIRQVLAAQENKEFNAAGKFQIIPETLKRVYRKAGLSLDSLFSAENQEKLFHALLRDKESIRDYLDRKSDDLAAAGRGLAQIWASVADPETGKSYYANNRASIPARAAMEALRHYRNTMPQGNARQGNTTIIVNAPTGNAPDITQSIQTAAPYAGFASSQMQPRGVMI